MSRLTILLVRHHVALMCIVMLIVAPPYVSATTAQHHQQASRFKVFTARLDTAYVGISDTSIFVLVAPPVCRSCISTMAAWLDDVPVHRAVMYHINGSRYEARQMLTSYKEQNDDIRSPVYATSLDSVVLNTDVLDRVRELQRSGPVLLAFRGGRMQLTSWPSFKEFIDGNKPWYDVLP